jgi:hypothetical protein
VTGAWALELGMRLCPNGVSMYGFTSESNLQRSRDAPYHYFDEEVYAGHRDISRGDSARALSQLARLQPQCVHLRHSSAKERPFRPVRHPRKEPRVDQFVDHLPHVYTLVGGKYTEDVPDLRQPISRCPKLLTTPEAAPKIGKAAAHNGVQCTHMSSHIDLKFTRSARPSCRHGTYCAPASQQPTRPRTQALSCTALQHPKLRFICNLGPHRQKIARNCKGECFPCPRH